MNAERDHWRPSVVHGSDATQGFRPPGGLPERLKELAEAGPALGPPGFDLDAVIRGGERRRLQRNAAVVTAGASLALVAVVAGASFLADWGRPSAAAVDLIYVQHSDSVLVSAGGDSRARVDASGGKTAEAFAWVRDPDVVEVQFSGRGACGLCGDDLVRVPAHGPQRASGVPDGIGTVMVDFGDVGERPLLGSVERSEVS